MTFINSEALVQALPGAVGAVLSLQFVPRSLRTKSAWRRLWMFSFSFIMGYSVSYYIGGATVEHFKLAHDSIIAEAIHFCFGLFGLSLVTHAMAEIRPLLDAVREKVVDKIGG